MGVIRDISDIEESRAKLEREKDFSEKLIDTAPGFIVLLDKDARIELFNKAAEQLSGYSFEEVSGKDFISTFIQKDKQKHMQRIFQDIIKKEGETQHENPITTKSGEERIILWQNTTIKQDGGIFVLSIGQDITEQRETEGKFAESKAQLGSILSSMEDMIFSIDEQMRFTLFHTRDESELFVSPEEFMGKKLIDVMPKHIKAPFRKAFLLNKKGSSQKLEYSLKINGEQKWYMATLTPLIVKEKFRGSVAVVHDITDRKKSELEKEKLNQELKHRVRELERFQKLTVGRELKMIELKNKIRELEK